MAPSPPKPWERSGTAPAAAASSLVSSAASTASPAAAGSASSAIAPASSASSGAAPALPSRPAGMSTTTATDITASTALGGYGATGAYGAGSSMASPYNSYSSYSSPYNRFGSTMGGYGSYGSSMYGGYGSGMYGGGYGSGMYGGGMYGGYGGMGMGGMGMGIGAPGEMSLSQQMEAGTAATFQILQSLVGAVGGFAQMLESTFMATHSSFFAMIGVAEQFGHLRNYLGQVLSIFALLRWCKGLLYRLVGKTPPGEGISADAFKAFEASGGAAGAQGGAAGKPAAPKMSKRPLVVFFLTVVGLPWLMNRLVRLITARQQREAAALTASGHLPPQFDAMGRPLPPQPGQPPAAPLDPSQLTFVRALFPYAPPAESADKELAFEKDDIIAVLSPSREERNAQKKAAAIEGGEGTWWMGRKRDGKTGWFPSNFVKELPMNLDKPAVAGEGVKA
ncbi:hypothetical protein JCM8547_007618 [Rhodosporidiobolus lusitaniae]